MKCSKLFRCTVVMTQTCSAARLDLVLSVIPHSRRETSVTTPSDSRKCCTTAIRPTTPTSEYSGDSIGYLELSGNISQSFVHWN